jgi:hypothetical protein
VPATPYGLGYTGLMQTLLVWREDAWRSAASCWSPHPTRPPGAEFAAGIERKAHLAGAGDRRGQRLPPAAADDVGAGPALRPCTGAGLGGRQRPAAGPAAGPARSAAVLAAAGRGGRRRGVRRPGELRRRAVVAEAVAELSHWGLSADQPDELLREALRVAVEVIGSDYGTAVRRLPDGRMRVAHEVGPEPMPTGTVLHLAEERSYVLAVVDSGEPFVSADLRHDPRVTPPLPLLDRGVVSGLAVPVRGAHSVLGVLALHSRSRRRFGRQDVAAASALASVVATAWEQVSQRERLGHQALHDPLTGLANRALFLDRMEHALTRRPSSRAARRQGSR